MKTDKPVILLALGQISVWAGMFYVFPALLVRWEQSLDWSKSELTGAITLALLVSAFSAPAAGRFIDRNQGPQLMGISAVSGGLLLAMVSMVSALWQFYLAWALIGVCFAGCLYEPCFAIVTRARGASAKQAIILITLIAGFAGSISFPLAHILSEHFHWRITLRLFALSVMMIGAPLLYVGASSLQKQRDGKPTDNDKKSKPDERRYKFLSYANFWFLSLGFALLGLVHGVVLHHLLPMLAERQVHTEVAVIIVSFVGPMQVAGRLAMMAAERHVSNHGIATLCFAVMAVAVLILIVSGTQPVLLILFVILFGGGYGVVSIIRPVIARDILGQESFGAKSGALALIYLVGSASAPYIGSLIWHQGGYDAVLSCLIVLAGLGLIFYLFANHSNSIQGQ